MPIILNGECETCTKMVKNKDCGVQCDWCDVWQHAKCAEVDKEEYEVLSIIKGCQKYKFDCEKFKLVFDKINMVKNNSDNI